MLGAFREYLAEKAVVRERYVPYFVRWVSECYAFLELPLENRLSSDQRQEFLRYLSKRHEDWQVKQADHALRLYDYFLSLRLEASKERETGASQVWQSLEGRSREALRLRHRSLSTEKTYLGWLRSFRGFVGDKEPENLSASDIRNFLSFLAVERRVSGATQSQALNALVFFYRNVLDKDPTDELGAVRAMPMRRLPVVLTPREVDAIFHHLADPYRLMAKVIYGCGLRLNEGLGLRVKDVDFEASVVIVRSGKGDRDRRTILPESLKDDLIRHLGGIRSLYESDREKDLNGVHMPGALDRKYPNAGKE